MFIRVHSWLKDIQNAQNQKKPVQEFHSTDSVKLFLAGYEQKKQVAIIDSEGKKMLVNSDDLLSKLLKLSSQN